ADAARAGVQHHADLPVEQPHRRGGAPVTDLVDDLHLDEVVAAAEAAELAGAALAGALGHLRGLGVGQDAAVLAGGGVLLPADALGQRRADPLGQHAVQAATVLRQQPAAAGAARDAPR